MNPSSAAPDWLLVPAGGGCFSYFFRVLRLGPCEAVVAVRLRLHWLCAALRRCLAVAANLAGDTIVALAA